MNAILEEAMPSERHAANDLSARVSAQTIIRHDEPLAKRTTLRVGGPADLYVEPASETDLAITLKYCEERGLKFFILGRGSNLLIRDGGIRGVVICLAQPCFNQIKVNGQRLFCGAGAKLKNIAIDGRRNGLSGFEFLEGIPGSLGGALRMNAGAMGSATFDVVESVRLMDFSGEIHEVTPRDMVVEYRGCATLKTHIALGAVLIGQPDSQASIAQRMIVFSRKRWSSQPAAPSAGCIFKNTPTIPAGKLIDELGLKGTRVGGAFVSAEHGNFIVNDGTATAKDVLQLIDRLKERAKMIRGIDLHTEVEIVGDEA
jgi:UDP-N-acetylenolpyruvoylglucosamine reductase